MKSALRALPLAAIVLASATALALPTRGDLTPTAPPRPTKPPVVTPPVTPPPPAQPATKGADIGGIVIGSPLAALDAKCKTNGWKCERSTRVAANVQFARLHITVPSGEYKQFIVTSTGGNIMSVKAYYRDADPNRVATLTKTYGQPTTNSTTGETVWNVNQTSIALSATGAYLLAVGVEPAKKGGITITPTTLSDRFKNGFVQAQFVENAIQVVDPPAHAPGEKISVKITLDVLECYDEQDASSVIHGDDPYLFVTAVHSDTNRAATSGLPWAHYSAYGDVESDKGSAKQRIKDTAKGHRMVFNSASDPRNIVRSGESIGLHGVVKEEDSTSFDDEVGFNMDVLTFAYLKQNAGKTIKRTMTIRGDGGYRLHYVIEVGQVSPDTRVAPALPQVNAKSWEGNYGWVMDGAKDAANIRFNGVSAVYPDGSLSGTWTENGKTLNIVTKRLFGNYVEFELTGPGVAPGSRKMVGYLVGTPQAPAIAGTAWNNGKAFGFYMTRK